jgi:tape measure domain-containing protein
MTTNRVEIVVATRDESSGTVRTIQGSFDSLATRVTAISFAFNQVKSAVDTLLASIKPVIDTALQFDALDTRLETVKGSAALAAKEMDFIRDASKRVGLEIVSSANSYSSFIASTKNSSMEGEKSRRIWLGVAEAIAAQRLPAETSTRVMWQLTQMVSKGKVTLEDLNIVAEALPGTLDAVANSMGITKAQLLAMIERGDALASDILPKLGEYFHKTFGKDAEEAAKTGQGAINNFTNAVTEAKLEVGRIVLPGITQGLTIIADNFGAITTAVQVLAGVGGAVVVGRIGNAAVTAAAAQVELRRAVLAGNAVMLDGVKAAMLRERAELSLALAVEAEKTALLDKLRVQLLEAQANKDAFASLMLQAQARRGLAVAEAEQAVASAAAAAAGTRYAAAAGAASIGARAAAGAARLLSGALAAVGGATGLATIAVAAFPILVISELRKVDREVKEQHQRRKEEQANAEQDAIQALADAKAREDRLVGIMGDSTDKQINEIKRKTQEKLTQQDEDEKAELAALQKAGFNFSEYLKLLANHRKARIKILEDSQKQEKEVYAKESLENLEDRKKQLKVDEDYFSALGNLREKDRAALDQQYIEALKQVELYYAAQKAKVGESGADLAALEEQRQKAVFQVQNLYAVKRGLLAGEEKKRALEVATSEGNEKIALIRKQISDRARTEVAGEKEIAGIQADLAKREYETAQRNFEQISAVYGRDSKEFIDAQKAKETAFTKLTSAQITVTQKAEEEKRQKIEKSSLDYQLELTKRLDWLKDSERDGLITCQQAARDKLEAEVNYSRQVAELKARAVKNTTPDTTEYKTALAEKYAADRDYAEKKKFLEDRINAENIASLKRREEEIRADSEKSLAELRGLAEGFYAQWDMITNRVVALGPKVAAAFGASLKETALDTVDKLKTKLDEVAKAVRQAAEASRDMGLFSSILGEHAERAEKLTYRYYSQRLAVAELTEQLKKMGLATDWQIQHANSLVKEMDLLNDSDLEGVRSEVDRLTASLKEAQGQAEDTVDSLRDELDEMLGNKTAIEERDYEAKKDELLAKLADAQKAGNTAITQEYQEALKLLEEIHKKKMANIKEEAEAARKAAAESSSSSSGTIPGFAGGGRFPGPDSPVDNLIVKVRSGEWGIRNEAVNFWESNIGRGFMTGINDPLSAAGRQIWERLQARATAWKDYIYIPTPRVNFAAGGAFSDAAAFQGQPEGRGGGLTIVVNTTSPVNERLVRRRIIPEIERYEKRKK